jgi:hypothetical protein
MELFCSVPLQFIPLQRNRILNGQTAEAHQPDKIIRDEYDRMYSDFQTG